MLYDYRAELTGIRSRLQVLVYRDTEKEVLAPASVKLVVLS